MEHRDVMRQIWDFQWNRDHYTVTVDWEDDYYPDKGCVKWDIQNSRWKVHIKNKWDKGDSVFRGATMRMTLQRSETPSSEDIGAVLCKKLSDKMGFLFSHAFVKYAELKEEVRYNNPNVNEVNAHVGVIAIG